MTSGLNTSRCTEKSKLTGKKVFNKLYINNFG